jgi:two-component system nitrogen regulation response regulator GlnG
MRIHGEPEPFIGPEGTGARANESQLERSGFSAGGVARVGAPLRWRTPQVRPSAEADGLLGRSPAIEEVRRRIRDYGPAEATVLVRGESGTGKELVARALHRASPRSTGPFVALNCAALPETLVESELFGHTRGAFTGAERDRVGLFPSARDGTLFLDEVGELTPASQAKLLRVLDRGTFRPIGAIVEQKADVRVVAATNRELLPLVEEGKFRRDLYYRLAVLEIRLPPLRERIEDIPILVASFLERRWPARPLRVAPHAMGELLAAAWPGNVRELESVIERTVLRCSDEAIHRFELLPPTSDAQGSSELTRDRLASLLARHRGRLGPVAADLRVSIRTVQRHLAHHRLARRAFAAIVPLPENPGEGVS